MINQLILVEQIHIRATHFVIGRDRDLCFKDRLIKLNLLPLNYWLEYLDLVFFYKFLKGDVIFARHFSSGSGCNVVILLTPDNSFLFFKARKK